jgi:EAL domain-containing protein (putative c-di-GMP-specific phosphodiesterase class I)
VRWNHPERGLLAAKDFIAVAEESGLITSIGPWVLEQACEQGARWRTASGRHPGIGVNVSVRQLEDPAFADVVAGVLERTGLPPDHLVLEVTERVLVDCADRSAGAAAACPIAAALQTVRDLGVLVALDDFGTGYSSLAYLRQLPVDWIKIDRNFITGLDAASTDTSTDRGIVHAIVDLARGLGLQVLGEGIETQAERDALAGLGCKVGQGYFFGYPSPPAAWDGAVAAMP